MGKQQLHMFTYKWQFKRKTKKMIVF